MPPRAKLSVIFRLTPADADDDARGGRDEVERIAQVHPGVEPDLRAEQADHAVQDHGDPAEHPARDAATTAPSRAQAEEQREGGGGPVGGRGVDAVAAITPTSRSTWCWAGRPPRWRARSRAVRRDRRAELVVQRVAGHLADRLCRRSPRPARSRRATRTRPPRTGRGEDGRPIQSACPTAERPGASGRRPCRRRPPSGLPDARSSTQDMPYPKTRPRKIAIRDQKPRRHTTASPANSITASAYTGPAASTWTRSPAPG
ncbi:hypothetical protein SGLAM104S_01104 [Streptomyces glaucescens]